MEKTKQAEQRRDNPYRSPIFRHVCRPYTVGKNLEHTGLVMEWWDGGKLCFTDVLHHCPPKEKGKNYYHQAVFPAELLATKVQAMAFAVADVDGKKYLPLDILLRALFESGKATRPFMEVIREFPFPAQEINVWHTEPRLGQLVEDLEADGFEIYIPDLVVRSQGKLIQQIFWWAYPRCPIHAAEISLSFKPKLSVKWVVDSNSPSLMPEFTKELMSRYPDPAKILRPGTIEDLRRLEKHYRNL